VKNAFAIVLLAAAASAQTVVWIDADHAIIQRPQSYGGTANVSDSTLARFGIVQATGPAGVEQRFWIWGETNFVSIPQAEIDAVMASEAEQEAEAAAQASLPAVFETGIAVLDEDGHHVELLPTGDGLPVIGAQVSHSPLTKEERDELKAAMKAASEARKDKAKAAKNDKEKIAVLMEAVFGINE